MHVIEFYVPVHSPLISQHSATFSYTRLTCTATTLHPNALFVFRWWR